jgi:hypothetical protein
MDSEGGTQENTLEVYLKKMLETLIRCWFDIYLVPEEYLAITVINVLNEASAVIEDPEVKDTPFTVFDPEVVGMSLATDPEFCKLLYLLFGTNIGPEELEIVAKRTASVAFDSAINVIDAGYNDYPPQ